MITPTMESTRTILRSLMLDTQYVQNAISQYSTETGIRRIQQHSLILLESEFETIVDVSRAILEAFSKPRLRRRLTLDTHLVDWLSSSEPETCLDTLKKMRDLVDSGHEVSSIHAAIALYFDHKAHFNFLLKADICNPENEVNRQTDSSRTDSEAVQEKPQYVVAKDIARKEIVLQKRVKLLRLLDVLDCAGKHRQTSSGRQSNTCTWLHTTDEYTSWREGRGSVLWLQGRPGVGKTVLASSVIDDLHRAKNDGELLAYFYCDFRTRRSTCAVEVLRSILAQLIAQLSTIEPESEQLLDELLREYQSRPDPFYNPKGLASCLSKVARLFPRTPFVVVDGLDECKEVESLLDGLIVSARDTRVFATSRPLQNIAIILSTFTCISMDRMASELSADIKLYITRELDSRSQLKLRDDTLKEEIRTELCARADGMFRWVQCQIDTLEKCISGREIRNMLKSLPAGLEETYRRILLAINRSPSDARLVQRVLVWLVASLRPIRMTELLEGVAIDPDYRMLDSSYRLTKGPNSLLQICQSLVVHNDDTDVIALSHMSVKEYLMGELVLDKLPSHHTVLEDAHESLARRCMAYIGFCLEESGDRSSILKWEQELDASKLHESHPLLKYILSDGFGHLGHLEPHNTGIFKDIEALRTVIHRYARRWDRLCQLVPSVRTGIPWPTSEHDFTLYTLIAYGSEALFETFVRRASLAPRQGTNPLVYAAHFGKVNHTRILISQGADVNQPGLTIVDSDSFDVEMSMAISLEVAVHCCQTKMIDILLAEGSIIPETLFAYVLKDRPQDYPPSVIRRLLQRREFLAWESVPWDNRRLLESVVDCEEELEGVIDGDLKLVLTRLVEVGCAEVLLLVAVEMERVPVIKTLLSMNRDLSIVEESSTSHVNDVVRAIARNGDTPLHVTMNVSNETLCLEITQLLVGAGCNPRGLNADDKPPIHIAVMRGYVLVVEYLLSLDIRLPPRILFPALQTPPLKQVGMIHLLLSRGANARILNSDGSTVLQVAIRTSDRDVCLKTAGMLLGAGCNPLVWNHDEFLHLAAKQDYRRIGAYLLVCYTCSEVMSLLDPNPVQQEIAFNALMRNEGGKRSMTHEEDQLFQIIRQIHNDEDILLSFIEQWADSPNILLSCSAEVFHSAVGQGFRRVVECILSLGCRFPQKILFTALKYRPSMIMFLVRKGADFHVKDKSNDNTPLYVAIMTLDDEVHSYGMAHCPPVAAGHPLSHEHLLSGEHGKFELHSTAIDIAITKGFISVAEYLLSRHVPLPPKILLTALRHQVSMIPLLIHNGANIDAQEENGDTVLHVAMRVILEETRCLEITKALVGAGCPAFTLNHDDKFPIHISVTRGFFSVAKYLLSTRSISLRPASAQSWITGPIAFRRSGMQKNRKEWKPLMYIPNRYV